MKVKDLVGIEAKDFAGMISILFFIVILFTPIDSEIWKFFLFLGIIFGVFWFIKEKSN